MKTYFNYCSICGKEISSRAKTCSSNCRQKAIRRRKITIPGAGYLYLIHCVGFPYYKIGMTTGSPIKRKRALQASMPFELDLLATAKTDDICEEERLLHAEFDQHRVSGEWFLFNEESLSLVLIRFGEIGKRANKAKPKAPKTSQ